MLVFSRQMPDSGEKKGQNKKLITKPLRSRKKFSDSPWLLKRQGLECEARQGRGRVISRLSVESPAEGIPGAKASKRTCSSAGLSSVPY